MPPPNLIEIWLYSLWAWFLHRFLRNPLEDCGESSTRSVNHKQRWTFLFHPCPNRSYGEDLLNQRVFSAQYLYCWGSLTMKTGVSVPFLINCMSCNGPKCFPPHWAEKEITGSKWSFWRTILLIIFCTPIRNYIYQTLSCCLTKTSKVCLFLFWGVSSRVLYSY